MGVVKEASTSGIFFPNCLRGVRLKILGALGSGAIGELERELSFKQKMTETVCMPDNPCGQFQFINVYLFVNLILMFIKIVQIY